MAAVQVYGWYLELARGDWRSLDVTSIARSVHPEDREVMHAALVGAIEGGGGFEVQHRVVEDGGDVAWHEQRGLVERDSAGRPIGIRGIGANISERKRVELVLRQQVEAAQALQTISTQLLVEDRVDTMCDRILQAAMSMMRADCASIHMVVPERDALHLMAQRGLTPAAVRHWEWVSIDTPATTGLVVQLGKRTFVADIDDTEHVDAHSRDLFRAWGVRSCQTTPLVSRRGDLLGAIVTYWHTPHVPSDRELRLFDVLVRHAADLIERSRNEDKIRRASWRDAFRVALTDALRLLADPEEIQAAAARLLGEYLGTSRAFYAEIDPAHDTCTIGDNYCWPGVASVAGSYHLGSLVSMLPAGLMAGETLVATGVETLPPAASELVIGLLRCERGAYVVVPLVKEGVLVATLVVQEMLPREWSDDEIALIEETADRTWNAIERARSQAAVVAKEERLRLAVDAADLGTWMIDFARGVSVYDDSLNRMLGFPAVSTTVPLGERMWQFYPDDIAVHAAAFRAALQHGTYAAEYRVQDAEGELRWAAVRGKLVFDAAGQPKQMFGVTLDITERKQMEEALRENDRRKDEFIATLAHELRNPLAPIVTGLEVLRMTTDRMVHESMREIMEDQSRQLVRLVDDLLDIGRINSGKIQLDKSRVDLASVVHTALDATRTAFEAARHQLTVKLPDEPVELDADRTRLAQVLTNLLTNAARYTPPGGYVTLVAETTGGEVVITVADNGVGMSPELLHGIFEMFVQGQRGQGLGIGLALVRSLVELHGGSVSAFSDGEGRGSVFEIRLPVATAQRDDEPVQDVVTELLTPKHRILVVDDNTEALSSLALLLRLLGNEVETACDGTVALDVATRFRPDVVFMDLGMPKLDGCGAARALRRMPWGDSIRLIAVTGWGQEHDRRRTKEAGFDEHLVKPVDPKRLAEILAQ